MDYNDLSDTAKAKAREWAAEGQCEHGWWAHTYGDAVTTLGYLGFIIDPDTIQFSGFWSQGDGASFKGVWRDDRVNLAGLAEHAPGDETLRTLGAELMVMCLRWPTFYVTVGVNSDRYCHSGTMVLDSADLHGEDADDNDDAVEVVKLARRCADWIYQQLEQEYDYQHSEPVLIEICQGYSFDEDGNVE